MSEQPTLRQMQEVMFYLLCVVTDICDKQQIPYWLDGGTFLGAHRHQGFIPWDDDVDICMLREDFDRFVGIASAALPEDAVFDYALGPQEGERLVCRVYYRHSEARNYNSGRPSRLFIDIVPLDYYTSDGKPPEGYQKARQTYVLGNTEPLGLRKYKIKNMTALKMKILGYLMYIPNAIAPRRHIKKMKKLKQRYLKKPYQKTGYIGYGIELMFRQCYALAEVLPAKPCRFEGRTFYGPNNPDAYLKTLYGPNYMTPLRPEEIIYHLREVKINKRPPIHLPDLD